MARRWKPSLAAAFVVGISLILTAWEARAGHPLGTEDAATIGKGNLEVECNCERSHDREGNRTTSVGNNYTLGLFPKTELEMSFAYLFLQPDAASPNRRGFGDTRVTLKTSFHDGTGWMPALGIKAGVLLPTGDETTGLGDGRTDGLLTLIADWESGNIKVHANAGIEWTILAAAGLARDTKTRWSLAAEWEPRQGWVLVSEYSWEKDGGTSKPVSDFLIGGRKDLVKNLTLDTGIRWGLNTASPTVAYLAGLTLALQPTSN
jgi:hypothetical protein